MKIAIDGPSGAGKSTISKLLSKKLSYKYIDTGAMYRAVAYIALQLYPKENILNEDTVKQIRQIISMAKFDFIIDNDRNKLVIEFIKTPSTPPKIFDFTGDPLILDEELRNPTVTEFSSKLSVFPIIREVLVEKQRAMAKDCDCVVEGRDIGTVVLKDAEVKIFLTASDIRRAERRLKDFKNLGLDIGLDEVLEKIRQRDRTDTMRDCSPLKKADDAVELDTSDLTIDGVIQKIIAIIKEKTN